MIMGNEDEINKKEKGKKVDIKRKVLRNGIEKMM